MMAESRSMEKPSLEPETEPVETPVEATPASVTMTGCLERSDQTFQLKDASGANVPKARTWKTGFLKKSSSSVAVVDPSGGLNLSNHVGQRVTVTGTLVDREMQLRSLQRVAASCSGASKVRI
jgi:hypothetical protein